ncbi:proton-conducting transporter transmembrane domain-containing protein [Tuwongella immobilis]|uniref:NADH:quinone oxidoreductase/Mrp antiporter transmembrane domain-containing protein n=1 Tax=Tuwongella immobilis TaxID=692036 RepID=A0A6C2YIU3_9BACT|nr:proton-conducting transporter membrane subunit [Tuwongella immobilis]VIP01169.1 NADH:ubiquinone oxidoreductase subunit 4 (Chain M) OS=Singulisphaera acidiphila (strain ATCC BAA-1392 / DSM 18658 / VKM B-2454 / MOB10) GN=Sinac_5057 PE=4 SV=1: Oxidored_q1 [Tuwongella immobilis]VTR97764.1 NADH:ubiquinone oxidoreductase subunit 4 (Chain M) OS=Singulisphaera acidiphila (strain ATCC BAA-1392 / DSM 18658 / VKM B-2454 / MOB10) GN=Sinac_5057 PE=4 SV=1: Oxidored_q1 [Tuwongella immobilis]
MNILNYPWIDAAVLLPLLGALLTLGIRDRQRCAAWTLSVTVAAFGCALLAWLAEDLAYDSPWSIRVQGKPIFFLDSLNAPLVVAVALLHALTVLTTAKNRLPNLPFTLVLVGDAIRLAIFASNGRSILVLMLVLGIIPPLLEMLRRKQSPRLHLLHMGVFLAMLLAGYALTDPNATADRTAEMTFGNTPGAICLTIAILLRSGTFPMHLWLTDLFARNSFGSALLVATPLTGVYAAIRLLLPIAPNWLLSAIGGLSLLTAAYAAGMTLVQRDARRWFVFLFLSNASLVLVGLELHTTLSVSAATTLWGVVVLTLGGLGVILRAMEARVGRLPLTRYHGLYDHSPSLAVAFLLAGLGSVGFPGTIGFIASEMLFDGVVTYNLLLGMGVVLVSALNSIAIVRVYFLIFTGTKHPSSVSLAITPQERVAVLTLAGMILGGGFLPQAGIQSHFEATRALLKERATRFPEESAELNESGHTHPPHSHHSDAANPTHADDDDDDSDD